MQKFDEIDNLAVANLRVLSAEMIERAGSGHPGLPLGAAPMLWALWSRHLRIDPQQPQWSNRDRFVLSGWAWFSDSLQLVTYERLSGDDGGPAAFSPVW